MRIAEEWAAALNRTNTTGIRLFGSKELGETEFERKANKAILIKGKCWAGKFSYDGPIMMRGSVTSPYFSDDEKDKTIIKILNGNFTIIEALENKYEISSGVKIIADNGDIVVGNVSGKREIVQDPQGRVGMFLTNEHFTELKSLRGKIIAGNVTETVKLEADTITVLNLIDNIKVKGRDISIYGRKVTHDVEFELMPGGSIHFYDPGSGFDVSDDAVLRLENGKIFKMRELKRAKMIGYGGAKIAYDYLESLGKNGSWPSKLSLRKTFSRKK